MGDTAATPDRDPRLPPGSEMRAVRVVLEVGAPLGPGSMAW
jgi:hypothetical protein